MSATIRIAPQALRGAHAATLVIELKSELLTFMLRASGHRRRVKQAIDKKATSTLHYKVLSFAT